MPTTNYILVAGFKNKIDFCFFVANKTIHENPLFHQSTSSQLLLLLLIANLNILTIISTQLYLYRLLVLRNRLTFTTTNQLHHIIWSSLIYNQWFVVSLVIFFFCFENIIFLFCNKYTLIIALLNFFNEKIIIRFKKHLNR